MLVYLQPKLVLGHQLEIARVGMSDVSMEDSSSLPSPNVIEPDPEEDFFPKSIPDKDDVKTIPEKKASIGR